MKIKFLLTGINIIILSMFIQITSFAQPQEYDLNEYGPSNPTHFTDLNGTLFFSVGPLLEEDYFKSTSDSRMDIVVGLYKMVDSEPVKVIDDWDWISINNVTAISNYVYFSVNKEEGSELWRSDGINNELIKTFSPYYDESSSGVFKHEEAVFTEINFITEFNGSIFFTADDGDHGDELWISDGTTAGTTLFKEIHEGSYGANITALMVYDGNLYFPANDGVHGSELWISDGTPEGTVLHENICPESYTKASVGEIYDEGSGSEIEDMVIMGDYIYFSAYDGYGTHLWQSNANGTTKVTSFLANVGRLESFDDNVLYFSASISDYDSPEYGLPDDPEFPPHQGEELKLWRYNPNDGFVLIDDGYLGVSTDPKQMIKSGDLVYFAQNDHVHSRELWATDGFTAWLVKDIYISGVRVEVEDDPDYVNPFADPSPRNLIDINGKLFFTADEGEGSEYWRSNGTEEGTVQVTDINPILGEDVNSPEEEYYGVFNNIFYFPATSTNEYDMELWSINILHFTTQPVSATKYVGDNDYSLTAVAVGEGELTYQWKKDGEDIEGATAATLTFDSPLTKDDAGTYTCVVTDDFYGALTSDEAVLVVNHAINISEQPVAYTAMCEWNAAVTLSVVANSTIELYYQWYKDGEMMYGYTESTLTVSNNPFNSGTYTCLIENEDMELWSVEAVVEIGETTSITGQPSSQLNQPEGTDISFLVIANGENLQYQWRKDGVKLANGGNIEGVSLPVLTIHGVTAQDEGEYDCVVIGECLVLTSQRASLSIEDTEDDGTSTSLDELEKLGISVFPNPSDGKFTIQFKDGASEVLINIYDITGKSVYSHAAMNDYFDIDISENPIGIYILNIEFGDKIINSKIVLE